MSGIRTPRQQRGINTKNKIIKAAFKLFAQKGIHGTNSKEIAEKAEVSIGSFYSYFKNKKTLLLEMLEDYLENHYKRIWQALSSIDINNLEKDSLKQLIQSSIKAYDIAPEFHCQTHALRYSDADIKRIYDRERKREVDQIQFIFEKNIHNFASTNDTHAAAMVIHNSVESVAHTIKFFGTDIKEEQMIDSLVDMISSFFFANE